MGNNIGGKRKGAKVMQLDDTSFRVKPPAAAADVLRDHPGFQVLGSKEVKLLGACARPLAPDVPLRRSRLYFLVGSRERLESLMLARCSISDLSLPAHASTSAPTSPLHGGSGAAGGTTPVRLKMRLPRAQVEKLMGESRGWNREWESREWNGREEEWNGTGMTCARGLVRPSHRG